ncbi:hypothetical protein HMN09_00221700 [Mycena chlorophos]|uniref:PLC-like phosphodiesterase n=1 Tax=Mycena chlorophos TaxID=658473 RepID=A0A8H6TLH7_MYCCL|nr:hypothetical protein HMN09_00221700 [Mycena chlorophos]
MFSRSTWSLLCFGTLALSAAIPKKRATVCNGHAELCDRSYGNVTFIGAHDSFAFSTDPLALAADQHVDVATQLSLGARLLQAQSHVNNGVLHFCHTSCLLFDGGSVQDYLTGVKSFLDANPNEVLTLLFTNPENQSPLNVWKPIFDAANMTDLMYVPPSIPVNQSAWPTLGEMIDAGTRVVMFMDAGADGSDSVPFILPEFQMVWETPFSNTDDTFPCSINRTSGPLPDIDHMYLINHSLNKNLASFIPGGVIVSDPSDAPTTNGNASILANVAGCTPLAGNRNPNFLLLDFVDEGTAFAVAGQLNGL